MISYDPFYSSKQICCTIKDVIYIDRKQDFIVSNDYELTPDRLSPLSSVLQPCGLCSGGTPACIYDQNHPEVSFIDRVGVSVFSFVSEYDDASNPGKCRQIMFCCHCFQFFPKQPGPRGSWVPLFCSTLAAAPHVSQVRVFSHIWHLLMSGLKFEHDELLLWSFAASVPKRRVWLRSSQRPCCRSQAFSA